MPNFTLSEIVTIALVILIVFGPQRLPEIAQKAGALIRRGRTMANDLRREFEGEFQEVAEPLKAVSDELKGVREDVSKSIKSLSDEVQKAKQEIETELEATSKEVGDVVTGAGDEATNAAGGAADSSGDEGNLEQTGEDVDDVVTGVGDEGTETPVGAADSDGDESDSAAAKEGG